MSSPIDNEADHDDRPTDESPQAAILQQQRNKNNTDSTPKITAIENSTDKEQQLTATVNPQIDLFVQNFQGPQQSVLTDRRKSEHHRKKS